MKDLLCAITLLLAVSVHATAPGCDKPPLARGCLCEPASPKYLYCETGLKCAGNKSQYDYGTCGGFEGIDCPRDVGAPYVDFWVQNTTKDYCANTQIRTCSDGNGCVGTRYRNDTTPYQRCVLEYGNSATGHYAQGNLQLPVKVRVPADTKYVVFACDPEPGVKVPLTSEFWPSVNKSGMVEWPKSMPPMGKNNCSECFGDGTPCPYKTTQYFSSDKSVTACPCCSTCAPHVDKTWTYSEKMAYQQQADAQTAIEIPPGAKDVTVGVPPNVVRLTAVPLYIEGGHACVVDGWQSRWGPPRAIALDDAHVDNDCRQIY